MPADTFYVISEEHAIIIFLPEGLQLLRLPVRKTVDGVLGLHRSGCRILAACLERNQVKIKPCLS